jgi:hypothetical protein
MRAIPAPVRMMRGDRWFSRWVTTRRIGRKRFGVESPETIASAAIIGRFPFPAWEVE